MNKTVLGISALIIIYFVLQKMHIFFHVRLGLFSFLFLIIVAIIGLYVVLNIFFGKKRA
jgi:hypothetical protein